MLYTYKHIRKPGHIKTPIRELRRNPTCNNLVTQGDHIRTDCANTSSLTVLLVTFCECWATCLLHQSASMFGKCKNHVWKQYLKRTFKNNRLFYFNVKLVISFFATFAGNEQAFISVKVLLHNSSNHNQIIYKSIDNSHWIKEKFQNILKINPAPADETYVGRNSLKISITET